MNMMLSSWTSLDNATANGLDVSSVESIRAELNNANRALDQMGNEQEQFNESVEKGSDAVSNLATKLAGAVGSFFALSTMAQVASEAIDFASDLAEVQNVVDVSFGDSANAINEWSKTTLDAFGLNELSAKQYAGTMGAMLKSSGLTGDAVSRMSMKIAELSGDMASFYNLQTDEAFQKIRSGISGETEPLKQLGINMSVANLEAFALANGIEKAYSEMTQAEQVTLRYNYLLQATADAQGDFTRTSDSFANQQKLLAENWRAFTGELATGVLPVLADAFSILNGGISFLAENWSIIQPILIGLGTWIAAANIPLMTQAGLWLWNTVLVPAYTAVVGFLQHGYNVLTSATYRSSAAQLMYNSSLLACPLTWILLIIVAVIAAIYAIVAAINKVTGSTISATGIVVGALTTAVAFIWNLFLALVDFVLSCVNYLVNPWIAFANFFGNLFNDPIGSIIHLFGDMADNILGILESIAKAIDKVFGSNLAGAVQGWRGGLDEMVEIAANKHGNGSYEKVAENLNLSSESLGLSRWAYTDAWDYGYDLGAGIEDKVSGMFGSEGFSTDAITEGITNVPAFEEIAGNTGDIKDSLDITNENLKYMRDLADQGVVNRFTTAEIRVDMTNNNSISSAMDLDGVVDYMVTSVQEAMERVAEGVHA